MLDFLRLRSILVRAHKQHTVLRCVHHLSGCLVVVVGKTHARCDSECFCLWQLQAEELRVLKEQMGAIGQATLKEKVFAWWSSWQTNLHRHCFGSLAAARFEDSDNLPDPLQNDLETQRAAVEQKYQTQTHRVEVLSGQIKSFKKDIEDYQKRVSDCVCCPYACVTISHKSSVLRASPPQVKQNEQQLENAESMSTEMRTEIITSRQNLDGLKVNVDLTKASQSYILTGLVPLSFLLLPCLFEPSNCFNPGGGNCLLKEHRHWPLQNQAQSQIGIVLGFGHTQVTHKLVTTPYVSNLLNDLFWEWCCICRES